jgi:hypothetical protein
MTTEVWPCKWIYKTRIMKRALELNFKRKRPIGVLKTSLFNQVLEDIKKTGISSQQIGEDIL